MNINIHERVKSFIGSCPLCDSYSQGGFYHLFPPVIHAERYTLVNMLEHKGAGSNPAVCDWGRKPIEVK